MTLTTLALVITTRLPTALVTLMLFALCPSSAAMLVRPLVPAHQDWTTLSDKQISARASRKRAASEMRLAIPEDTSLSFLEWRTVGAPTRQDFSHRVIRFVMWCYRHSMNLHTDDDLDLLLVTLFDELFFKGMSAEEGIRLIAALCFFLSNLGRLGRGCLPRAHRCLRGWRLVDPQREKCLCQW